MSQSDDEFHRPIIRNAEYPAIGQNDNELDPELTGCSATPLCNPSHSVHRFIALIFMCLLGFGSYFCYDNPGALQDNFREDLNLTTTQFVMLYSIYSWPNVVLCFIGGFLIDRVFGIRLGTIIYLFILLIGQLVFATGGILDAFWLMIVGRFIFGIGAESLAVATNNYAVLWFKGKELNMVFGLQLSFARVGSTVNFIVMEPIYKYVKQFYPDYRTTGVVLLLASTTCFMSFLCALVLGWMDKRAQRILHRNDNASGETAKLSDIITFKMTFWMVTVICVSYYVAIFPFIALGKVFFETKFGLSPEDANTVNSLVYVISAIASPLFGFIIDKTGKNVLWIFIATTSTIFAHTILAFTHLNPYVGMVLMGLSYSMLASSLWPLVALIIPEYQLGTAYGICQSVQNLGLAVVSIIAGLIIDKTKGNYLWLEVFFIGWLIIALLATITIWIYDNLNNGYLNMTPQQRKERLEQLTLNAASKLVGSGSVDEINPEDIMNNQTVNNPVVRNRINLRRSGSGGNYEEENISDRQPLLN